MKFSLILWSTPFSSGSIDLKFSIREFLRSLITNPSSQLWNSKWQTIMLNLLDWDDTEDFWARWLRILAQNSEIRNVGSNMADENSKSYLIGMIFGTREFWGRWLRPELWISIFKMADPISLNKMQKVTWLG